MGFSFSLWLNFEDLAPRIAVRIQNPARMEGVERALLGHRAMGQ